MADAEDYATFVRQMAREVLELHRAGPEEALARAEALVLEHGDSALAFNLLGYLHREAAVRAREQSGVAAKAAAEKHLSSARDALSAAMGLAPKSLDIAVFLGNLMFDSEMYVEAEHQLGRATSISGEIDEAATHSVLYDLEPYANDPNPNPVPDPKNNEKDYLTWLEVRNSHLFYSRNLEPLKERVVPKAVMAVLDAIEEKGAAALLQRAATIAKRFRYSGRARILPAYTEVQHARSLDAASATDRRRSLRRALEIAQYVAGFYTRSLVIALFHAQLLFVLGEHDAAEMVCRRALDVKDPADPNEDDIPPGSFKGEDYADRVSSVKKQLRGLLLVKAYWCSMAIEKQVSFLSVKVDTLLEHYGRIDLSVARDISDAQGAFKEHGSLRSFWICPSCHGEAFFDCGLFLRHICEVHLEVSLQEMLGSVFFSEMHSALLPELGDDKAEGDHPMDEITLCQDSGGHDVFRLNEISDSFVCLPHFPSCGIEARPFMGIGKLKCRKGNEILQDMKEKLKILPAQNFSNKARCDIQDVWIEFCKTTLLDYRKVILPLARSFQWRKLKKCMTEDAYIAGKNIEKADIDAIFVNVADDQSAEEMASFSGYLKSVNVLNKYNCDEDLLFLNVVTQALWNLRYFKDECVRRPLIFQSAHDDPCICISDKLFDIFSAWEKNNYDRTAFLLTTMKTSLCEIANDRALCQKGREKIASETVATILKGLHMSGTPLHFEFNSIAEGQELDPISCADCICRAHDLFGLNFHVQKSCQCAKSFDEKEYSTFSHKLDVGSSERIKMRSLLELPVLLDGQLCCKDTCNQCGSLKHVDHFLTNTPHFFTIVLNWLRDGENQNVFSELLIGITSPVDINVLYKGVHSAAKYILSSMIGYTDGSYVCFSRYQDRWLIYDASTVKAVGSWLELLECYRDCKLQPEVLFFEIIK